MHKLDISFMLHMQESIEVFSRKSIRTQTGFPRASIKIKYKLNLSEYAKQKTITDDRNFFNRD